MTTIIYVKYLKIKWGKFYANNSQFAFNLTPVWLSKAQLKPDHNFMNVRRPTNFLSLLFITVIM